MIGANLVGQITQFYNDAISRAYYAMFSSITLLFYVKGRSFSKHKGLIDHLEHVRCEKVLYTQGINLSFSTQI